jgi:hypothetical protein
LEWKSKAMTTNIVEAVQKNLGYPSLQKVDPNSQEVNHFAGVSSNEKLAQAAITAVLAGLAKFSRSDDGAQYLFSNRGIDQNWLEIIFSGKQSAAVDKVAHYSGEPVSKVAIHMQKIADEAVKIIHESIGSKEKPEKIRTYMKGQRHNILLYLPAAMQMGDLLNDDTLDDRTNKMEGPISSFMHKVEDKLSGGGS